MFLACLEIPEFRRLVHRSCGAKALMRVKSHSNDLILVTSKSIKEFSGVCVPKLGCGIETASENLVSVLKESYP
jgi:hypothetical protein